MVFPPERSDRALRIAQVLVAITLAGIVFVLLFPTISDGPSSDSRKIAQAKNDVTQIATALGAYLSEYGHLPTSSKTDVVVSDDAAQSRIMDALCPPNPKSPPPENPKGLVFLEIPKANKAGGNGRVDGAGPYRDPWGKAYFIALDADGDGVVRGPAGSERSAEIRKNVLVWTQGDPKRNGYEKPERWIKSWE